MPIGMTGMKQFGQTLCTQCLTKFLPWKTDTQLPSQPASQQEKHDRLHRSILLLIWIKNKFHNSKKLTHPRLFMLK